MKNLFKFLYNGWGAEPVIRPEYHDRINTIPNWITLGGLCTCVLYILLVHIGFAYAWWVFIPYFIACLSDVLDGLAARLTGQRSKWGEKFDPARDCAIISSQADHLGFLAGYGIFLHPLFAIMIMIEVLIGIGGLLIGQQYQIKSHTAGKIRRAGHSGILFLLAAAKINGFSSSRWTTLAFLAMAVLSAQAFYFYASENWAKIYVATHHAPRRISILLNMIWRTARDISMLF
jgi:phosphatidylglycerophosphate synthase